MPDGFITGLRSFEDDRVERRREEIEDRAEIYRHQPDPALLYPFDPPFALLSIISSLFHAIYFYRAGCFFPEEGF